MKYIKLRSFEEIKHLIDTTQDIIIADVREVEEYATGHVENAVNLPLSELIDVSKEEGRSFAAFMLPDKTAPVMVYCRTGRRSELAADALSDFGYEAVYDMGSLSGWPYGISNH